LHIFEKSAGGVFSGRYLLNNCCLIEDGDTDGNDYWPSDQVEALS
jgi:hypothetical protein